MRKTIFLFSILTALQLSAQPPARFPVGPNGLPASPANPGLPASAVNAGLPGFDNSFAPFFTNQSGNTFIGGNLNQLLLNLQFDLAQVWPVLASINDSFDFTALGVSNVFGAGTNTTALGAGATGTRSGNSSTLLSSSSAANLGTVLGQDLSTIAGGRATAASPTAPALGGGFSTAVTPTPIGTNSFGVLPSFFGNGFAFTSTRDVLRALIILQDDVEKMLPLVNALNGGNPTNLIGLFPTNNVSVATNNFFTTTPATRTPVPTPTGR